MSLESWTVDELELLSSNLIIAGREIAETCAEMRKHNYLELVLQARSAQTVYMPTISKLAGTIKSEFRDQHGCSVTGRIPAWQLNQKKIEARRERDILKGDDKVARRKGVHVPPAIEKQIVKRPVKKKSPKRSA